MTSNSPHNIMRNVVSSVWPLHLWWMMIVIRRDNFKRKTICSAFQCPFFVLVSRYKKVQLRFTVHITSQRFSQTFCCCAFCWSRSKLCTLTRQIHHLVSAVSFAPCSLGVFSLVWGHADPTGAHRPVWIMILLYHCSLSTNDAVFVSVGKPPPLPYS